MYVKASKSLLKINSDLFYMIPFNWNNQSNWSLWWKKGQSVTLQGRAKRQNIVNAVFYRCSILLHYFMYFCWSKYFRWKQQLFSTKLLDLYSQLSQWSPPLVQIKEWQWSTQGERYLHSQSERKMMESCKLTIDCGQSYGVIIQMKPIWRYFYKRELTVIKEEIRFWDKPG